MASYVIHMAVASEVNKILGKDNKKILLGSIAPDISKLVGETKKKSHFLTNNDNIPNIELFLNKYGNELDDDFVMGYFIHLYTDYLWFKYFLTEICNDNNMMVKKLDGTKEKYDIDIITDYLYNDYSNINVDILNKYGLDLDILDNNIELNNIIDEIPMTKLYLLIDNFKLIINNSNKNKDIIFNIDNVIKFIATSRELIVSKINEIYGE